MNSIPHLVSVIIPTYNRALLITETVGSVLNQTYRPIEIIIVDDGSTDQTEKVCETLIKKAKNRDISLIYHKKENGGVSTARNAGTTLASGEFIQYLDSDDLLHPQKLEIQVSALVKNPNCSMSIAGAKITDSPQNTNWVKHVNEPQCINYTEYSFFSPAPTPTPIYRRKLINKIPAWEEGLNMGEDRIFILHALIESKNISHTTSPLVAFCQHEGPQLTSTLTEEMFMNKTRFHKTFWNIASKTPETFQKKLLGILIPTLTSNIRYTIAKGYTDASKALIRTANHYPLSKAQKKEINKLRRCMIFPRILCRIAFRLGFI